MILSFQTDRSEQTVIDCSIWSGSTLFAIQSASYRKNPKISDTRKFAVITLKVEQDGVSLE